MTPMQDSYIGNTTASQAVKAGSTPVSCSKKKTPPCGVFSFWKSRGSRTYSSGTVRWTVPAPSSRTGCYHNSFLRMRKRMQIDSRIRRTPLRGVFFLDKAEGVEPLSKNVNSNLSVSPFVGEGHCPSRKGVAATRFCGRVSDPPLRTVCKINRNLFCLRTVLFLWFGRFR